MYLRNFLTLLRRYSASSALNIAGLGIAFAAVYLIAVQVHYDFSYNRRIPESGRIYRLEHPSWYNEGRRAMTWDRTIPQELCSEIPEIEAGGPIILCGADTELSIKRRHSIDNFTLCLSKGEREGLDVFGFRIAAGSLDDLRSPDDLLLKASTAARLGLEVGDRLHLGLGAESDRTFTLVALFDDFRSPGFFDDLDGFVPAPPAGEEPPSLWQWTFYLRLAAGSDPAAVQEKMRERLVQLFKSECESQEELDAQLKLLAPTLDPLTKLYFAEEVEGRDAANGNRTTTWTLLSIAVLILAVAFINFVNFFFALIPVRIRAVNIGKIFGAPQWKLRIGLLFETAGLILSAAAVAFGLVVIFADTPLAGCLTAPIFAEWRLAAGLLTLALAIGVAASLYPAWYLTRFPPLLVVTGSFRATDAGRRLRYLLVGVQYTIALVLIAATLTIHRQHRYMMRYDMGFDREQLYCVTVPQEALPSVERRDALIGQLLANPEVAEVAAADGEIVAPERNGWGYTDPETGKLNLFSRCLVSWNFLEMMGINLLEGRLFTPTDEAAEEELFIANETAKRQFGLTLETQFPRSNGSTSRMIGFCEDFHFKPMQFGLEPFLFTVSRRSEPVPNHLYIRMAAGVATDRARDCIRRTILGFAPSIEPERIGPHFIDEELESNYQQERKLSTLVLLFSMLSILISMMGVFGLVLFETQCRRREIGIRRVNGATVGEILALFNRKFLRIVLLCAVVAIPAGYAILDRWLSQFAYRAPIVWWIFAAAFAIVAVITIATVTARSWHAATENPSHVMKANN